MWAYGSPHALRLREGLPHSRIGSRGGGGALYFKLRRMESDKNLGPETEKRKINVYKMLYIIVYDIIFNYCKLNN